MHAGKNLHRRVARIVAHKLLVDFQNPFQLPVENLAIDVCQVEINHRLAVNAEVELVDDFKDGARGHVARHQIAVFRIPLLEEVPTLALRNRLRITLIARSPGNPDAAALSPRRLRHQPQLILARNRRGMNLNELAVRVVATLLIQS